MNRQKLLCVLLMCFGFSLVYAAAQTQPAAGPPVAAPTPPLPPAKTAAPLPDPQTPQEFFARARQLSDLEASGIPFHLKATYVASGDAEFTGNGTYEEWWQSKDLWRKEATLDDYRYVEIQSGGKNTVYGTSNYIPLRLRQMLKTVVIRIAPDAGTASAWKLTQKKLSGIELAVLSSEYQCAGDEGRRDYTKCVAQDYFNHEGVLRIRLRGSIQDVYNDFQALQNRLIPRNIGVAGGEGAILTISVTLLEPLSPSETIRLNDTRAPAKLLCIKLPIDFRNGVNTDAGVTKGKFIMVAPIYPAEAKLRRIQGTVVIDESIDESGNIREPYVVRSAGPLLDKSALDAVRHWKYIPVEGVPVNAETTASIVYALTE